MSCSVYISSSRWHTLINANWVIWQRLKTPHAACDRAAEGCVVVSNSRVASFTGISLAFSRTRLLLTVAAVRSRKEEPIFYFHSCETAALFHMKIIVCCCGEMMKTSLCKSGETRRIYWMCLKRQQLRKSKKYWHEIMFSNSEFWLANWERETQNKALRRLSIFGGRTEFG